jgi:hypothetical protein
MRWDFFQEGQNNLVKTYILVLGSGLGSGLVDPDQPKIFKMIKKYGISRWSVGIGQGLAQIDYEWSGSKDRPRDGIRI